jgi:hypothetical protein
MPFATPLTSPAALGRRVYRLADRAGTSDLSRQRTSPNEPDCPPPIILTAALIQTNEIFDVDAN